MSGESMLRAGAEHEDVARDAAYWMTELMADDVSSETRRRWHQWLTSDPAHGEAWARFESLGAGLRALHPEATRQGMAVMRAAGRRSAMKRIAAVAVSGAGLGLLVQTQGWRGMLADYRTSVGERRELILSDGSRLLLNTDSVIDVDFGAGLRRIRLLQGEVLVETGKDNLQRPLRVETAHGWIAPLGTRFLVRQRENDTLVAVLEHRVAMLADGWLRPYVLEAGQRAVLSGSQSPEAQPVSEIDTAWMRGELVADNMRLADFLDEVGRYRRGWLRCDPAVADLRLTALFPYLDTDRVLASLPNVLPVRLERYSRYWVTVVPA